MASLQSRISSFITALGADIKQLQGITSNNRRRYGGYPLDEGTWATSKVMGASVLPLWATSGDTGKIQTGTLYRLKFRASKTAAGTGNPTILIKIGPNIDGTDTTRATLAFGASTGAIDEMECEVEVYFTQPGATAKIRAKAEMRKRLNSATGWGPTPNQTIVTAESAEFDVDTGDQYIYAMVTLGTSVVATVNMVTAELENMAV